MNAAFLIMSSAALVGADPAPPQPPPSAPAVVSSGVGCSNCGVAQSYSGGCGTSSCGSTKVGLLDRIKARCGGMFGKKKSHGCGCGPVAYSSYAPAGYSAYVPAAPYCTAAPAPAPSYTPARTYAPAPAPAPCCSPAPAPVACNTCQTSCCSKPNLLDNMKGRWCKKKSRTGPCCDPCAGAVMTSPAPAVIGQPGPTTLPGTTPPQEMPKPKTKGSGGNTSSIPQPLPSVKGASLTGSTSPY